MCDVCTVSVDNTVACPGWLSQGSYYCGITKIWLRGIVTAIASILPNSGHFKVTNVVPLVRVMAECYQFEV